MYKKYKINEVHLNFLAEAFKVTNIDLSFSIKLRCIGWDKQISRDIGSFIIGGDKVATYSLPWLHEQYPWSKSKIGEFILHVEFDGTPFALVQIIGLELIEFGEITEEHSKLDGPPVRNLDVWLKLHREYWGNELEPFNKNINPKMPVIIEKFKCVYSKKIL